VAIHRTIVLNCHSDPWCLPIPMRNIPATISELSTLRWENSSHHYNATYLSGYVTGSVLSRLCIMSSTRLKNLRWTASDTMFQRDLTNHVPIIISSLSILSLLYLSSSQSTISLWLLPPYAPRNETSIFVASYGRYCVQCRDTGFTPQTVL